ncbi:hypothetical protein C7B61_00600 [filamentous cyanobacterium CCP1]|nr:hypothetical protein C7B76_03015 [filamentous cyanobacterium CCP2]PSB68502.1 hypothetical protein C7B61_00600 [filamentous cyanobacterium CCP1]
MTQEFHISVTPVGKDEYLVRTERVAPGVPLAEEQVVWPVGAWLAQARQLMNDPLLGILEGNPAANTIRDRAALMQSGNLSPFASQAQPPISLVELGQQLYGSLFRGMLRDSWVTAQGIAQHRNESLRLRLGLKGPLLPRLPWEVLYGNDTPTEGVRGSLGAAPRPLATGTHVIFSRYQPSTRLAAHCSTSSTAAPNPSLRVLMVIAAPTDRERLELEREAQQLQQELQSATAAKGSRSQPEIQLTILKQPGREQLTQALEQGRYQVFHYAGHSDLGANGGSLYLVNNRTGLSEILSGDDLAGLLVNNGIRLAVFNSCRGAYTAASEPSAQERNLAEALVSRGIPAVLAMAEQIPDNVALTLTWSFYRNLKLGYPIDLSLSRARQGLISAYGSHQLYWALPILYLHPDFDGYLTSTNRAAPSADQLILMPQSYSALPILATEEVLAPLEYPSDADASQAGAYAIEGAASSDWQSLYSLDENYEEDANVVAELLRQLSPSEQARFSAGAEAAIASGLVRTPSGTDHNTAQNRGPLREPSPDPDREEMPQSIVPVTSADEDQAAPARRSSRHSRSDIAKRPSRSRKLLSTVGLMGAISIAVFGVWSLARVQDGSVLQFPPEGSIPSLGQPQDWQTAEPERVKSVAIDYFKRQDYAQGEAAVTILLDRGELQEAAEALASVPTSVDSARINFLWGRLAWQGIDTGNPVYTLRDARRYWERATRSDPDNALYLEALGFAYYSENDPMRAMQTWAKALAILEDQPMSAQQAAANAVNVDSSDMSNDHDILTTYAGISLALWKSAIGQSTSQQDNLLRKSSRIYQTIQQQDPTNFQPQVLRRSWLWNEATIRDWEALGRYQ